MATGPRCSEHICGRAGPRYYCTKPVVSIEDGKPWCRIHLPSAIKTRRDKQEAAQKERWAKDIAQDRLLRAAPDLLKALQDLISTGWPSSGAYLEAASAAILKAGGSSTANSDPKTTGKRVTEETT